VQAHFEGVVIAVMAAVDQVAQAANSAWSLQLQPSETVKGAFAQLGAYHPDVKAWYENPIGRDLRRIRTRMAHYAYAKLPAGPRWTVEVGHNEYPSPRDLGRYALDAVAYCEALVQLLDDIEKTLARGGGVSPTRERI
jgi:hypothetical protein